jgi:von Willebrand factor type A domain/Putative Flp pilus-assembly TadE/G-like
MRRGREHGGITPLMVGLIMVLLTILVGASAVGRLAMLRQDAQRGADAACLVAANVIRLDGLPFNAQKELKVAEIALRNLGPGASVEVIATDEQDQVSFECIVQLNVGVPWGAELVTAKAAGKVAQKKYDNAIEVKPRFVLVLDYSGSMERGMVGDAGGRKSIDVLKDAVRTLFEMDLPVKYGAVLFSDNVTKIGISPDAPAQVRAKINTPLGPATMTGAALDAANEILSADPLDFEDQASYVLLVSDGQPNDPSMSLPDSDADARAAAQALRDGPNKVYIHTLHIVNQPTAEGQAVVQAFMEQITGEAGVDEAGAPRSPDIEDGFHAASSDSQLREEFEEIAGAIACPVQLDALPEPGTKLHPFLRAPSQDEVVITDLLDVRPNAVKGDLNSTKFNYRTQNYYFLVRDKKQIFVTKAVCDKILKAGHIMVLRYEKPRLTE